MTYINLPPMPPTGALLEVWYYAEWVVAIWTGREWRDEQGRYFPGVIWWREVSNA